MSAHNSEDCPACQAAVRMGLRPPLCDVGLTLLRKAAHDDLEKVRADLAAMTERATKAESDAAGRQRFEQWYAETVEERDHQEEQAGHYYRESKEHREQKEVAIIERDAARAEADAAKALLREVLDSILFIEQDAMPLRGRIDALLKGTP